MNTHPHTKLFSLCQECGDLIVPQEISQIDYFQVFEIPISYFIDQQKLQNRFYELSRILHPDKYQTKSMDSLMKATRGFAFLTRAYDTLKSSEDRAKYIFSLAHFTPTEEKSSLPAALAEEYFNLLENDPDQKQIQNFSDHLNQYILSAEQMQNDAFKKWEEHSKPLDEKAGPFFQIAAKAIQQKSYLKSMTRDLEKRGGNHGPI